MAGKGGGAWRVAYADFVTAMMAFFLVMWIVGQDQKIRRAVSYYFNDPFNPNMVGTSKKPTREGSIVEASSTGSVPETESVAMGAGRKSYTPHGENSASTKLVSDTIFKDKESLQYWRQQAARQREEAKWAKDVGAQSGSVSRIATQQMAKQLRDEFTKGIPQQDKLLFRDLLRDAMSEVNWTEIAEDLMALN